MANEKKYTTIEVADTLDVEFGATAEQLLPLIETNNKLATSNKTLTATNKTLAETCQEQAVINDGLADTNAQLTATNSKLTDNIIPTLRNGLQTKTVQPNESEQVITADDGYIGLKEVVVKPSEYVPIVKYGNSGVIGDLPFIYDVSGCTWIGFVQCSALTGVRLINTQNLTSLERMFYGCGSLVSLDMSGWDVRNVTSLDSMFYGCGSLVSLDMSGWDVRNVTSMQLFFAYSRAVKSIDVSGWKNCESLATTSNLNNVCSIQTYIGKHTLAEVEAGLTCFEGIGRSCTYMPSPSSTVARYASMLAFVNGMYDRTEMTAGALTLSKTAFNNMRNDDDTIPTEAVVTERQTKIRTVCAAKNYTLTLS